jgi:hypothetical protein
VADDVEIVPYDPAWPALFATEARRLRAALDATPIVEAYRYEVLKRDLAARFPADREAYTGQDRVREGRLPEDWAGLQAKAFDVISGLTDDEIELTRVRSVSFDQPEQWFICAYLWISVYIRVFLLIGVKSLIIGARKRQNTDTHRYPQISTDATAN